MPIVESLGKQSFTSKLTHEDPGIQQEPRAFIFSYRLVTFHPHIRVVRNNSILAFLDNVLLTSDNIWV